MVTIDIDYTGELHCEATHGPSGTTLTTDAPADNHGKGESFSPTDLVATGLGTCIATILGIQAEQMDVDVTGTSIRVEKEMTQDGPRRIAALRTTVHVPRTFDAQTTRHLEVTARACPVHRSIHDDVDAPITFHWGADEPEHVTAGG